MIGRGSQTNTQTEDVKANSKCDFFALRDFRGYTIVEVMIFLAVTSLLFVMIAMTFSGRQAGTEFSLAARDMESQLQDIANDVSSGYYSNPENLSCTVLGGIPHILAGSNEQGTNEDCIFIGRVAHFDLAGANGYEYNMYSVVGARQAGGRDSEDFDDAVPLAIATSGRSARDLTETNRMPVGLQVHSMWQVDGSGSRTRIRAVGFFTSFGSSATAVTSTSLSVNIVPIGSVATPGTKDNVVTAINTLNNSAAMNPAGGIEICMDGDSTDQYAVLKIGSNNARLATDVTIEGGSCSDVY